MGATEAGFTLLEIMITAAILLSMVLVVTSLSKSGSDAERFAARLNRSTEVGQEILDDMRRGLASSVRVLHSDTLGVAYADLLELSAGAPRIQSRLPKLRSNGIFEKETASERYSGNSLVFARHAWTAAYEVMSGRSYNIDVYRVYAYYLRQDGDGLVTGNSHGLNLARFVSEPLADARSVDSISDSDDSKEVMQLLHAGRTTFDIAAQPAPIHPALQVVWRLGQDPAAVGTFRQIDTSTWGLVNSPQPPRAPAWRIQRDATRSSDRMMMPHHHSVATNWSPAAYGVGQFSVIDPTGDGFPHGFETQLIGPTAARQVLIRLTVVSTNRSGQRAYSRQEVIQDCRDI